MMDVRLWIDSNPSGWGVDCCLIAVSGTCHRCRMIAVEWLAIIINHYAILKSHVSIEIIVLNDESLYHVTSIRYFFLATHMELASNLVHLSSTIPLILLERLRLHVMLLTDGVPNFVEWSAPTGKYLTVESYIGIVVHLACLGPYWDQVINGLTLL